MPFLIGDWGSNVHRPLWGVYLYARNTPSLEGCPAEERPASILATFANSCQLLCGRSSHLIVRLNSFWYRLLGVSCHLAWPLYIIIKTRFMKVSVVVWDYAEDSVVVIWTEGHFPSVTSCGKQTYILRTKQFVDIGVC